MEETLYEVIKDGEPCRVCGGEVDKLYAIDHKQGRIWQGRCFQCGTPCVVSTLEVKNKEALCRS